MLGRYLRERAMILCSCNMITDRDVKASVKPCGRRADRARDVFHSKGSEPKCGRCIKNIHAMCNREYAEVAASGSSDLCRPEQSEIEAFTTVTES
jgi:bacterioferritin-associated ferredoxin